MATSRRIVPSRAAKPKARTTANSASRTRIATRKPAAASTHRATVRKRDPEAMQGKILQAATEEFSRHGYAGARVERISHRARTVDRMLYYYFGSKEQLFRTVLEGVYERLGRAEQQLHLAQTEPLQGMRELIAFTWDYYLAHPEFIQLLNSENQHRGEHLKKSKRVGALSSPLLAILGDLLARGARAGVFRQDADPVQVYITIAALGYFYLSNRYTLSRFLDRNLMADDERERWSQHLTEVVLAYLRVATPSN